MTTYAEVTSVSSGKLGWGGELLGPRRTDVILAAMRERDGDA